jgi:hypothetical protein
MKYKITAAEYAALSDDTKAHYGAPNGEGLHVLRLEGVDVIGLQAKVDEFRTTNTSVMRERDQLTERLKAYDGLDAAAARAALAEVDRLKAGTGKPTTDDAVAEAVRRAVESAVAPLNQAVQNITAEKAKAEQAANAARFQSAVDAAAIEVGVRRGSLKDVRNRATEAGFTLTDAGRVVQMRDGVPVYAEGAEVDLSRWLTSSLRREADWMFEPNAGGSSTGSGPHAGATRVIENPTAMDFGANAADIASGKVAVTIPALG